MFLDSMWCLSQQNAGIIEDPYREFNELNYRWVAESNWMFNTTFTLSSEMASRQNILIVAEVR